MFQLSTLLTAALAAAAAVHAAPVGECEGGGAGASDAAAATTQAIYFMTNDAKANSIIALPVGADGMLSDGTTTATGGSGSAEVDATSGKITVPDALSSQGSVRVAGNHLFAVNAGSNSVTMFRIGANDATKLTMVGQPVNTCGEFPVTMAVSMTNKVFCVANSGAVAGVSCGKFSHKGLGAMDPIRPFQLNQKTPPTGPFNTVAETFFNDAEDTLFTTVKGDPTVKNTGFLSSFAAGNGQVGTKEVRTSPNGTAVLFGTNQIPGTNNLLATDASFGAAILSVDGQKQATVKVASKVADQKATCWVTISKKTGTAFLTDVGKNHLLEMDVNTGAIQATNLSTTNPGMLDISASGNFLYALSPGNGSANISSAVAVFDVSGGKGTARQIQNFNPQGVTDTAQGMAVRD